LRSHRLLELYLHEKLGFSWDEVHDEADRLEHAVSQAMTERMAAALGHPTHGPHGHAIPAGDLTYHPPPARPLSELAAGEAAAVQYVRDDDPAVLRALDAIGLRPGADVIVLSEDAPNGVLWLAANGGESRALDMAAAGRVFVTAPEPAN
jgi:DtxR family Mn-dependent transcriptional regulator